MLEMRYFLCCEVLHIAEKVLILLSILIPFSTHIINSLPSFLLRLSLPSCQDFHHIRHSLLISENVNPAINTYTFFHSHSSTHSLHFSLSLSFPSCQNFHPYPTFLTHRRITQSCLPPYSLHRFPTIDFH